MPGRDRPVYDLAVRPPLFELRFVGEPRRPTATAAVFAAETGFRGDRWLMIRTELLDDAAAKEFLPHQLQGTNILVNDVDAVIRVDADGWQRVTFGPLDGYRIDLMSAGVEEQSLLDIAASIRFGNDTAAVGAALAAADLHLRAVRPTEFEIAGPWGPSCYDPTSADVSYSVGDNYLYVVTCYSVERDVADLMEPTCPEPRSVTIRAGVNGWMCPAGVQLGRTTILWREADEVVSVQSDLGDDATLELAGSIVATRR